MNDTKPLKPPTAAYALVTSRDRSAGRAVNLLLIVGTLATNWVLLFASPIRLWGLYLMLVFIASLLVVDVVRLLSNGAADGTASSLTASFVQNDVRVYILIWIFWLIVGEFFFLSRTSFGFWLGFLFELPMLVATFVVSLQQHGHQVARTIFPLLALLALAFPTRDWMPQHEWWPAGVLRVALYFFAVLVAGYALPHRELRFDVVRDEVATALATHPKTRSVVDFDEEDIDRTSASLLFSATVAHCQSVCLHETERTLTIVALSAWILLVSRVVVLFFGLFLLVVQLIIFFVRRSEYEKLRSAKEERGVPPLPTSIVAATAPQSTALPSTVAGAPQLHGGIRTSAGNVDDDALDDAEGSVETAGDADETSGASDSTDQAPQVLQPPMPQRFTNNDDVRRRSPPASGVTTPTAAQPPPPVALLQSSNPRVKTKVFSISKP